jgi:hypothetical protein
MRTLQQQGEQTSKNLNKWLGSCRLIDNEMTASWSSGQHPATEERQSDDGQDSSSESKSSSESDTLNASRRIGLLRSRMREVQ